MAHKDAGTRPKKKPALADALKGTKPRVVEPIGEPLPEAKVAEIEEALADESSRAEDGASGSQTSGGGQPQTKDRQKFNTSIRKDLLKRLQKHCVDNGIRPYQWFEQQIERELR